MFDEGINRMNDEGNSSEANSSCDDLCHRSSKASSKILCYKDEKCLQKTYLRRIAFEAAQSLLIVKPGMITLANPCQTRASTAVVATSFRRSSGVG